jgi:phage terminase large subunit-like protein
VAVGATAGLLKGATGVSGPPVILYLLAGPEEARLHRANLILFFAIVSVISIIPPALGGLMGLAVLGRCKVTRDWLLWNRAWAQSDVFDRRKDIVSRLKDFIAEGSLIACETATQDIEEVVAIVKQVRDSGLLPKDSGVGLDPQGVSALVDGLAGERIVDPQVVGVSQGYRLSGAVWGRERKLKDGTLWHAGQDLMSWCVGNAKAEQRGNATLITKQAAGKAKIDPLDADYKAKRAMVFYEIVSQGGIA